jgi:Tfp pilus assembly protein PilX
MKIPTQPWFHPGSRSQTRGSAVLIVMVVLGLVALLAYENSRALNDLEKALKHIDHRQQQRYG